MSKTAHRIYIFTLSSIVLLTTLFLAYQGYSYYSTVLEERFYHPRHDWFKPSGLFGQGLGIIGTLLIFIGVFGYIARKRYKFLSKLGRLKYWLEFHIFLCSLGPIMVLFHTAFKFGGIVSVAFWSMVAVVVSGVIGRFIYIQIPRTIEGRELSLSELQNMKDDLEKALKNSHNSKSVDIELLMASAKTKSLPQGNLFARMVRKYFMDKNTIQDIKKSLRKSRVSKSEVKNVVTLIKKEIDLSNRIDRLQSMQKLFKYWHVVHMPFAIIMLVIVIIHIGVTVALGYRWIF